MNIAIARIACLFGVALGAMAAGPTPHNIQKLLPKGTKLIETATLPSSARKPRILILWMYHPTQYLRKTASSYCGDRVQGDAWQGPVRLSLLDVRKNRLIQTIKITDDREPQNPTDKVSVPFLVSNEYWTVPHLNANREGKPRILNLRDLTGDGNAAEFAFHLYAACGIVDSSVFGYNERADRLIQYPVEVLRNDEKPRMERWAMQIFSRKPFRPGQWHFVWSPAEGSNQLVEENVTFDAARQLFVEKRKVTKTTQP